MTILIRTALFVPGNRPERIEKALNTDADVVIIDLEDAVPLSEKEATRSKVREKAEQFADRMVLIRVNSLGSPFIQGDLQEVLVKGVKGIILPKVERADDIHDINKLLLDIERKRSLPEGAIRVFPLIESASGVQHIHDIVSVKTTPQRIYTVAFGAADYTLDMGIEMTLDGIELFYARSRIAVACKASGIAPPIDTPFMIDLNDIDALTTDALRAKKLGFQGKLVIHPKQIEPCNRIFSPSPGEIARAEKIIQAFERAQAAGVGVIQLDGKLIDEPIVQHAKDILAIVAKLDERKPAIL